MIILNTVDTAPFTPGILLASSGLHSAARNLVNVSISRARGKLVIVADVAYFRAAAPRSAIADVLDHAAAAEQAGSACPNWVSDVPCSKRGRDIGGDTGSVAAIGSAIAGALMPDSMHEAWYQVVQDVNQHDVAALAYRLIELRR